jgi:rhodanese-related sulfurtransferase
MIKPNVLICSLLASCALLVSNASNAADTPAKLAGVEIVDAAKVKSMMASGAILIDTRVANEFAESHIKGAINVPYKEKSAKVADFDAAQDSFDLSKLPSDKTKVLITQCNGPECWKSYKSAVTLVKAGYKKVFWFRNGIPEWKAKGFAVE